MLIAAFGCCKNNDTKPAVEALPLHKQEEHKLSPAMTAILLDLTYARPSLNGKLPPKADYKLIWHGWHDGKPLDFVWQSSDGDVGNVITLVVTERK